MCAARWGAEGQAILRRPARPINFSPLRVLTEPEAGLTSPVISTWPIRVLIEINLEPRECYQMAFTPLHDRVLVKRIAATEKTKGGLIIPETAKEKPAEGEIVSVGQGARKDSGELIAPSVKAGDRILFGKWSGTEVTLEGVEMLIMKESDIMGIIS